MFVNESAVDPATARCSNSSQVTVAFNDSATFGVPSVPFNATSIQASGTSTATGAATTAATSQSSANIGPWYGGIIGVLLVVSHIAVYTL